MGSNAIAYNAIFHTFTYLTSELWFCNISHIHISHIWAMILWYSTHSYILSYDFVIFHTFTYSTSELWSCNIPHIHISHIISKLSIWLLVLAGFPWVLISGWFWLGFQGFSGCATCGNLTVKLLMIWAMILQYSIYLHIPYQSYGLVIFHVFTKVTTI